MHTGGMGYAWDGVSDFDAPDDSLDDLFRALAEGRPVITAHPVSASDVAVNIRAKLPGVPRMKLLKLLYFAQAEHLLETGQPLFKDRIEAWPQGPVVRSVWIDEMHNGGVNGDAAAVDAHPTAGQVVDVVLEKYGRTTGAVLSELTHRERPWRDAREGYGRTQPSTVEISPAAIRDYYEELSRIPSDDEAPAPA